jgi:Cu+-exporting ATPase
MQVDEDSRHALTHEGKTYRFCSVHCLERFRNDPDSFLNKKGAV